jgi:dCTP deaminase
MGNPKGGVLPIQELKKLQDKGIILAPEDHSFAFQPASIDLTLGETAYRVISSFLPQNRIVQEGIDELSMYAIDLSDGAILERGAVYIIPLIETINLPRDIIGKTNPKSSTGRLDIFTRVITDRCARFEEISSNYNGKLYLEVVPRSFTIRVKKGQSLNQLRLFQLSPDDLRYDQLSMELMESHDSEWGHHFEKGRDFYGFYCSDKLLFDHHGKPIPPQKKYLTRDGLLMSVNLSPDNQGNVIGYKSKKNSQVIDLAMTGGYDADDFWEAIHPPKNGKLILEPEEFYIFASKEFIRIPLDYASEMVEFDAGSGELRTHYAGFFDPGFGYGKSGEIKGTKAVLEVRPHDVPFIIEDGQILFKMKYEQMLTPPSVGYGAQIGSNYHDQSLKLSKLFTQK